MVSGDHSTNRNNNSDGESQESIHTQLAVASSDGKGLLLLSGCVILLFVFLQGGFRFILLPNSYTKQSKLIMPIISTTANILKTVIPREFLLVSPRRRSSPILSIQIPTTTPLRILMIQLPKPIPPVNSESILVCSNPSPTVLTSSYEPFGMADPLISLNL